ncbi:MAG: hypothetical protein CMH53_02315 [Myxococcales bacterium]|nr:hypothetical protein [Myxococcales bacterium]
MDTEARVYEVKGRRFVLSVFGAQWLDDLVTLHGQIFTQGPTRQQLAIKYDASAQGRQPIATIAHEQGRPVAFHGALPYPVLIDGDRHWIGHSCDYITSTDCRRLGLHSQLAALSFELMQAQQMIGAFAMFSEVSEGASVKMGWQQDGVLQRFHIPTGARRWGHRLWRMPGARVMYRHRVMQVLGPYLSERKVFRNSLVNDGVAVDYGPDFMSWKTYGDNHVLSIGGAQLWVRIAGRVAVGASYALGPDNIEEVVETLVDIGRRCGVSEVMFQLSAQTHLTPLLSRFASAKDSYRVSLIDFTDDIDVSGIKFNYSDFDTF